ncbi:MAG: tRNA epoxyqueuosine(34) reductase QueG, partial [Muribaculaceae bacterium]|nr:tRNA epoxyqueuosine(34) reductase QueG [Muribaculaceae bacterium]
MNCCQSQCSKDRVGEWLIQAGANAWGVALAESVDPDAVAIYDRWIASGAHGGMDYLERYSDVRNDPRLLLDGAQCIIVAAFNYQPSRRQDAGVPVIADYALGDDYHTVLRQRLDRVARQLVEAYGGTTRVCVDTAPLRERYWAVRAGVGFVGISNQLIIPGYGSRFFLGEILWTGSLDPDEPCRMSCDGCMRCVQACPGAAIEATGGFCAARCLSYLTIEHRGDLPASVALGNRIYGCDRCQDVCPHNRDSRPTAIAEFEPRPALLSLTCQQIGCMTQPEFSALFRNSAIKRTKLSGLQR